LSIPAELAARAAFLARLHRQRSIDEWLTHIIQERVELEEAAFVGAKRELATKNGG
jgi:competence protein ComGF